jgi:subtilisin-like proprotein convertase family protein
MQNNFTKTMVYGKNIRLKISLMIAFSSYLFTGFGQQYVNGNVSTGTVNSSASVAPAGGSWSELQGNNSTLGFNSNAGSNNTLLDDFTVFTAPWNISKITFYAFSTGYTGVTSPFDDVRVKIYSGNPSTGTPNVIYGDLTTNRLAGTSATRIFRIASGSGDTTRQIWKVEATINQILNPGTYWIEWQVGSIAGANNPRFPTSTVLGSPTQTGNNAIQHNIPGNTWSALTDGTPAVPQDLPFVIDYTTAGCSVSPDPGATISSVPSVCPGVNFNLNVANDVTGFGITQQWQSSSDNVTYTDITGTTGTAASLSLTADTWYRLAVTCTGNPTVYSTPALVEKAPAFNCLCESSANNDADEEILRVKIGTLDNESNCDSIAPGPGSLLNKYSNFMAGPSAPAPGILVKGGSIPFEISVGLCNGFAFTTSTKTGIWIDLNRDGAFTTDERLYLSASAQDGPLTERGTFAIPATADTGITAMRIVTIYPDFFNPNPLACGNYGYGETEDYLVNIQPCIPARLQRAPSNASASCNGSASFSVGASGSELRYAWQYRATATSPWMDATDTSMFSGLASNTITIRNANSSMNGYQFRALYSNPCSAIDFTANATLTVTPLTATVNPGSIQLCQGSMDSIRITNSLSSVTRSSVGSGSIQLSIPDRTFTGVLSQPLSVTGIPANALIQEVYIKFNLTHSYVGDLDINLIAPNGQNLNLIGSLDNGSGFNGTSDFINTIISSTSSTPISNAPEPRTGTYAAEMRDGFGPTGNVQTAAGWNDLFTQINGEWKLAIADFAIGDSGFLSSWEITIAYSNPIFATGTWSPAAGLFTDATMTTPYVAGTAVNTVYLAPQSSTSYSVVVETPTCTSAPLDVPITVSTPLSGLVNPADTAVCDGQDAQFVGGVTTGTPSALQWQKSTDNGVNWSNVEDNGIYSGSSTNTLTIFGATGNMQGTQYRLILSAIPCDDADTTAAATLTVYANPGIALSVGPRKALYPGLTTTLTATPTPSTATGTYSWKLNGAPIAGESDAVHVADIDGLGEYVVSLVDQNGCQSQTSNPITITDTINLQLFAYPNPSNGQFQVRYYDQLNGVSKPRTMNIYNSRGKRVYSRQYSPSFGFGRMDVDLSAHGKGVYFIELNDAAGERLQTSRVVIQ